MKLKQIKIAIWLFIFLISNLFLLQGQNLSDSKLLPNIVPPSPSAYALGNYGNVPVGLFTGSPNISLPLITYKTQNLSVPLNLFYTSNGIRVDDTSSNVGLGWNLSFGGVISVMIRDKPDQNSTPIFYPENLSGSYANPMAIQFFYTLGNRDGIVSNTDAEADIYSFNFNGYSGKFFLDSDKKPHLFDQQDLKIENTNGFQITTPDGIKYYFSDPESSKVVTPDSMPAQNPYKETAYYLSKITHPNGDEVYYTYDDNILYYTNSQTQRLMMSLGSYQTCFGNVFFNPPTLGMIFNNEFYLKTKKIKSITSNNPTAGGIYFTYSTNATNIDIPDNYKIESITQKDGNGKIVESLTFNYLNTVYKRNFLTSIVFKDPDKSYQFSYISPTDFPSRLSYSQDHWGYFNGKNNINLVSKNIADYNLSDYNFGGADREPDSNYSKIGMLSKIQYPTKGYTELEYEGNTYWGQQTEYPPYTDLPTQVRNSNPNGIIPSNTISITSPMDQKIKISGFCAYYNPQNPNSDPIQDPSGYVELITNDTNARFFKWDDHSGQTDVPGNGKSADFTTDPNLYFFEAKAGNTYQLIFYAKAKTSLLTNVTYYATPSSVSEKNIDTGGVRIKSTKDYSASLQSPLYRRYYYGEKDNINHSSGNPGLKPYYIDITKEQTKCESDPQFPLNCSYVENTFVNATSSSLIPMFDTASSTCLYRFVTISEGGDNFEKGGTSAEFIINRDTPGNRIWGLNNIGGAPWSNSGWNNGLEFKKYVLKKSEINSAIPNVIQEKVNDYEVKNSSLFVRKNFGARKNFSIACASAYPNYYYTCTSNDMTTPNHPCNRPGNTVGSVIQLPIVENLDVMTYQNQSVWHYLKSQTTTDYQNGNPLTTTIEYFYNNPLHYQLTNRKTTFPDSTLQETTYQYAHEKNKTKLIESNIVGIPLETIVVKKQSDTDSGKTISKTYTDYPDTLPDVQTGNLLLPKSVSALDLVTGNMSTEVTYNQYDTKGNIQQYTTKDGVPTAMVWGYNKTQPIAKIEGAMYSQVSSLATAIIDASNDDAGDTAVGNPKEQDLLDALDSFRNNAALSGYQVTTYTYDPLIGVRSITPPNGVRQVYIYDATNRLKEIRENKQSGNLIKEFQYNYKH